MSNDASPDEARPVLSALDRISSAIATVSSFLLLLMTLIVGYEVASRYLFGKPTIWAWDINVQLMMAIVMLGIAEVYRRDMHIRVDVLTTRFTPRQRACFDVIYGPIFLFIATVILWTGWEYFEKSWTRDQHASTILAPPLWPIKFTLPLAGALLLIQGLVKLYRDLRIALGKTDV